MVCPVLLKLCMRYLLWSIVYIEYFSVSLGYFAMVLSYIVFSYIVVSFSPLPLVLAFAVLQAPVKSGLVRIFFDLIVLGVK